MSEKYDTRCWLCDSTDLEPDVRGMHCRSCGATFNVIPKPGKYPITQRRDLAVGNTSSSPSDTLLQAAAKVRDDAIH